VDPEKILEILPANLQICRLQFVAFGVVCLFWGGVKDTLAPVFFIGREVRWPLARPGSVP